MALPADGSPMLEGHPDNGKDHGKVWLNEANGEESRCRSPLQSVDCSTSSSGSSTTSSSGNSTTTSSRSSTTTSNKDEVDNEDKNDFKSRLRVVQVLRPNIKFLWGIEVLKQSLKHLNLTINQLGSADSSPTVYRADAASQLLEILPPNFKYIQDIGVAQKPQEDMTPCTSLEFTSGLGQQEKPILRPEKSRPIGTLQHRQVGLEEEGAFLTSGHTRSTTQKVDAAKEDDPPSKLRFGTVLPSSFKFTYELDKKQEPNLRPEDSSPINTSPQPLEGWKNLVASFTFGRAKRTTEKVDVAKEDDPPSKLSFGTVLPSSFKFTYELDKKQEPNLRPEDSSPISTSPQPLESWQNLVASFTFGRAKRTTLKVDAAKPSHQVGLKEDVAHVTSVTGINGKRTKDSDAEEQPPAKRTKDAVAKEELAAKRTEYSDDASWNEVLRRIGRRIAWRYGKEWEDEPVPSTPLFIPYRKTEYEEPILLSPVPSPSPRTLCEDPGLSSPVLSPLRGTVYEDPFRSSPDFSPSPLKHCEDPILSPRVFSPSPSTHCENPTMLSPDVCFWMKTEGDMEEEPTPSTSGGITETESSRHVWFRPRYVLSSDSD
ncbi:uncharacterized protein LOC122823414 [Gambusia affinis]|uniref:uncharacterized protein LOC122823414 n=1 Tax=Gambusia affinis TaxID=33528 RepID=UPI001CDD4638|nr:uncharacterized protein LOC122823414 [Gambusia affinis]XP_043958946.1 uncharacterized protein LOC122823414 [Gambusia affinis]XP_043958947.1 uncharacterized protein LOC122823414 [Gambusia affinis]XP_043958948.1 uncharacterized protein LOC122823414 [Gambusia affinis]XP_043958949.1 uncharacterized protein LOC122823414 [Gambusia affinis]